MPAFYGDLVYKLKKIVGTKKFQRSLLKYFHIVKNAIPAIYCDRLHAWWSTQSWVTNLISSLITHKRVGPQTL